MPHPFTFSVTYTWAFAWYFPFSNVFCLSLYSGDTRDVFLHEDAVYGLAVDPRDDNIYASACADGRVLLWDTRVSSHQGMLI